MAHMETAPPSSSTVTRLHDFARHFVRERLGCGCPEELLARIDIDIGPEPPPMIRMRVGGRLLVHIRVCPDPGRLPRLLAGWLADGVMQRDAMGFNRFRLVLATTDPDTVRADAEALFASLGGDERTHLHLVSLAEIAPLLPPPG